MDLKKNQWSILSLSLAVASTLCLSNANAGIVRIINTSNSNIKIDMIPEPACEFSSYCWKCLDGCLNPKGKQTAEIILPPCGFECFAVIGTEGGFLFNGRCRNLSVAKNYEVTFFNTSFGIGCVSKEI